MSRIELALLAVCAAACAPSAPSSPSPSSADLLIRGGTVYDGSGGTPYAADVVIAGDSIAAIDRERRAEARDTLDAEGMAVAPGFINMLSWGFDELLQDGRGESDLRQGVTLEIFGEGQSPGPVNERVARELLARGDSAHPWGFGEALDSLVGRGVSLNVASFVGATTVRLHDRGAGSGHGIETRFDRDTAPSGPGSMADFAGEPLLGTWTLSVQDVDASGVTTDGYIRPRTLHATIVGGFGCSPQTCAEPTPTQAPDLEVARVDDGGQPDLVLTWSAVAGAGYHVLQSADPRFLTGVSLIGNPATAAPLTLEDAAAPTPGLSFYEVRAVNACHFEGP